MNCYCDSKREYENCCKPFLDEGKIATTALELMRSRYSAFATSNAVYLMATSLHVKENEESELNNHFNEVRWLQLDVIKSSKDKVEYKAYFMMNNTVEVLHEKSSFVYKNEKLLYDSGDVVSSKIERNILCPCGSGKKYKKCHG